jgi:hypothetical protein
MEDGSDPDTWRRLGECFGLADVARKRREMVAEARLGFLVESLVSDDLTRPAALRLLSYALESYGAGMPEGQILRDTVRADAEFWAGCATPHELAAYAVAAVKGLEGHELHERMARRLIVQAWDLLDAKARAEFLGRVDPKGQFRRK